MRRFTIKNLIPVIALVPWAFVAGFFTPDNFAGAMICLALFVVQILALAVWLSDNT